MDRNLGLEFVRVIEAAAIAAVSWIEKGDKLKIGEAVSTHSVTVTSAQDDKHLYWSRIAL